MLPVFSFLWSLISDIPDPRPLPKHGASWSRICRSDLIMPCMPFADDVHVWKWNENKRKKVKSPCKKGRL
ncbi:hypothetical protein VTN00DRAFT_388 [Thermoascus crustaceus]|uniref:uncharacterized protein n=1 Tax=Thermoascus crustaceus TaxID=5088 RepID=UPI003743EA8A